MTGENYYAVIMAGGGGTRLWPLSRKTKPKQMLRLVDESTLFQTAVRRLRSVFPPDRILIVTVADQCDELRKQCPELPKENFILEPLPRGTAPVVGLAAVALKHRDPDATMAVLTADHVIQNEEKFTEFLKASYLVAQDGYLVTLGISPTHPATGYGYIQQGERIGVFQGLHAYQVERFLEKPDENKAKKLLSDGHFAWNSGMFFWRVDRILEEFSRQMPDLAEKLNQIAGAWGTEKRASMLDEIWWTIDPETIDYGIMEGATQVAVIPARDLGWSDVGSWDALFDVLPSDEHGNIIMGGEHVGLDTEDSLVYVNRQHRLIVTIGVDDLVVVDTDDVLLICRKDQAQKVRQIVNRLKTDNQDYI